jgi:hypothetical protein
MPISAWIMFLFGCVVLYGGLVWCISIAIRKRERSSDVADK